MDGKANLIPLPQRADPNAVLTIDLKLASRAKTPRDVSVAAPVVGAPVMLAEWKLEPDTDQRLVYRRGSLTPVGGVADVSGFATLARMFTGEDAGRARNALIAALLFVGVAVVCWRWAGRQKTFKFQTRNSKEADWPCSSCCGRGFGHRGALVAMSALMTLLNLANEHSLSLPRELSFLAPVQQAGSDLKVEVSNLSEKLSVLGVCGLCLARAAGNRSLDLWVGDQASMVQERRVAVRLDGAGMGERCARRRVLRSSL